MMMMIYPHHLHEVLSGRFCFDNKKKKKKERKNKMRKMKMKMMRKSEFCLVNSFVFTVIVVAVGLV